jgi:hypothetical protein
LEVAVKLSIEFYLFGSFLEILAADPFMGRINSRLFIEVDSVSVEFPEFFN